MKTIKFYRVGDDYGFLSNFSPYFIFLEGKKWPTVEHYFQASKFSSQEIKEKIRNNESPLNAVKIGRDRKYSILEDWNEIRELVMKRALRAKFMQHVDLKQRLIETASSMLVENTYNDSYWADGGDGSGKNRLGFLLMEVREEICEISNDINMVFPPWISFPDVSKEDMFWRMGIGESYLTHLYRYLLTINEIDYREKFPERDDWVGFYD